MSDVQNEHTFRISGVDAQQVYLIGEFNNWSTTATEMKQVEHETWEVRLKLPMGTYRYCYFAIDSGWINGNTALDRPRTRIEGQGLVLQLAPDQN